MILICGLLVTGIASRLVHLEWQDDQQTRFQIYADKSSQQIQARLHDYERGLRGTRSALLAVGPTKMTLAQYRFISESLDVRKEFPGSRGFGFMQRVSPSDEAAFLKEAAALGRPGLRIRQFNPWNGDRYIVKYLEPEAHNQGAIGIDVASEANRREAINQAIHDGTTAITPPVTIVQANGNKNQAFLLLLPVFNAYPIPASPAAREASVIGFTYSPIVIDEVIADINPKADGVQLTLSDVSSTSDDLRFLGNEQVHRESHNPKTSKTFQIFNRTWRADYLAESKYMQAAPHDPSMMVGVAGLAVSILLSLLFYREQRNNLLLTASQDRLEAFIRNAPSALAMFDMEMRYLTFSNRWLADYKLTAAETLGHCHYDIFPDLPQRWKTIHRRALAGESLSSNNEKFEPHKGKMRWIHWAIQPWYHVDGMQGGVIIFTEDVTDRQQMLAALEEAKNAAEVANRAKTVFIGNMSHELRTPVHQLNGMVAMFGRDALNDKQTKRLEMMKGALTRLDTVIGGILTLVDLESKSTRMEWKYVDLQALCADVLAFVKTSADAKGLTLSLAVNGLPEKLRGDPRHIRTILACYVNNAITFSEKGNIHVQISCEREDANKALIRLAVSDQGIGISEEMIGKLFQEFEQVDNSNTRRFGGTGVGLAIVRKLAIMMDGNAGCESVVGQGSTFWASIVLAKQETTWTYDAIDYQI